jgi:hypothetical protein
MTRVRWFRILLPVLVLGALALPSSASAQATRTWVSGVGDDANPCSRTAPCKTFAGAISKTAAGGEINCLDPGGFGGVTITKSLTIKCHYTEGGVLVSGTNAIVINAGATDKVTLRGLDINGIGTGAPTSLVGIKVLSAKSVHIIDSEIYRFRTGIGVVPTSAQTRVLVARSHIHDNGVGVLNAPGNNLITFAAVVLRNNEIADNVCGSVTGAFGANGSTPNENVDCGTATAASGISKTVVTGLFGNGIHDNGNGVFTRGALATAEIARNEITGNFTFGLHRIDSSIIRTFTPASNVISNNAASDAPNATLGMTRVRRRP